MTAHRKGKQDHWKQIGTDRPEKRPGGFAQDPSRKPPTRKQRERDYAAKGRRAAR